MKLASPASSKAGDLRPSGRLYLATNPTFLRLADRAGQEVQFILMPYPTPTRYLCDEETQRYGSLEEKNRHLQTAYAQKLRELQGHVNYDPTMQTVLSAHIHVQGATLPTLFRMSEQESIVFSENELPTNLAYVALGHIHQPQALLGLPHIRYSGSIERLDLGERRDQKGVVVFDVGMEGLRGEPRVLPLDATPVYALELHSPLDEELRKVRELYPEAKRDLVHLQITYTAGVDKLEETLRELEAIFPRWYYRHWAETSDLRGSLATAEASRAKSFEDTVRDYLRQELTNHAETERDALLAQAETLLREVEA
jgi:DNA repair exonuclease SbcCD nuclease subunit